MKLEYIPVPVWSPPETGPWRMRGTSPSGEIHLGNVSYTYREDAEQSAARANSCSYAARQGCTYDVMPDPGGAAWTYPR